MAIRRKPNFYLFILLPLNKITLYWNFSNWVTSFGVFSKHSCPRNLQRKPPSLLGLRFFVAKPAPEVLIYLFQVNLFGRIYDCLNSLNYSPCWPRGGGPERRSIFFINSKKVRDRIFCPSII